jgi:hypothetical protein
MAPSATCNMIRFGFSQLYHARPALVRFHLNLPMAELPEQRIWLSVDYLKDMCGLWLTLVDDGAADVALTRSLRDQC